MSVLLELQALFGRRCGVCDERLFILDNVKADFNTMVNDGAGLLVFNAGIGSNRRKYATRARNL